MAWIDIRDSGGDSDIADVVLDGDDMAYDRLPLCLKPVCLIRSAVGSFAIQFECPLPDLIPYLSEPLPK